MRDIKIISDSIFNQELDAYVYFLEHGFDFAKLSKAKEFYKPLEMTIKQRGFTGRAGSSLVLSGAQDDKGVYIILIGLGDPLNNCLNVETYRRAVGQLVRILESHKIANAGFELPKPELLDLSYYKLAEETSAIVHKAHYHFDEFITQEDRKPKWNFDLVISVNENFVKETQDGINIGITIGHAINTARYWCDMPPSQFTPEIFANKAKELAEKNQLKCTIFNEQEIIKMGMGGLAGVSRGSQEECRLVILEYKSDNPNAQTIALVGKGVTFDSGGISIKPAAGMETMKDDMAGAAVVLSTMKVIGQIKPPVNVIAVAPMSENMPSGPATKPGDILRFYNGKTAEVLNTDAEGRLILADALSYVAKNYKPDAIIDLATLTGACAMFLGPFYAGLMTKNEKLSNKILNSACRSGDRVWALPMDDDYRAAINSNVADIANIGSQKYKSGTITAAFFLSNFVEDIPWAHLDIAGVAFGVPDMTYLRPGATGFGIRLLVDLVCNWNK